MGLELWRSSKEKDSREYSWAEWKFLRDFAVANGWQPQGTVVHPDTVFYDWNGLKVAPEEAPEEWEKAKKEAKEWDGSYFSNAYQRVTDEDAHNMAEALTKALENIDYDQYIHRDLMINPEVVDGHEVFIRDFLEFCKEGSFLICP